MLSKILALGAIISAISAQYVHDTAQYTEGRNAVQQIAIAPAIAKYVAYEPPSVHSYFNAPVPTKYTVVQQESPATLVPNIKYVVAQQQRQQATSVPNVKYVVAQQPASSGGPAYHQEEYAHPKYEYAYSVEDHHTGDSHSQQEQRDGDHVVGQYSLREADGTIRIVKYYDDGHGFNAVIERQGTPTEQPAVAKESSRTS